MSPYLVCGGVVGCDDGWTPALPDFTTAAGMVVAWHGRIPHAGEHFDWRGWRFEVVDLDGARVDKLLVSRAVLSAPPVAGD